uniref:CASP8 and FADD-like apoptosis regulator n=1 Tax=Monopterus albus TaxID=43700 RepID=A0A3Q3K7N0_MONAL|nr:CASP8 and FADD-like apoptosis regulator [Monopterus albus]
MASPEQHLPQVIPQMIEALSSTEVAALIYLCGRSETDSSSVDVKEMLESKVILHENSLLFLAALMWQLRRLDIMRKLFKTSREELERITKNRHVLPRFRVLMVNINEDIASDDLSSLKFLLSTTIPRDKTERAKNFLDVVIELEKLDLVAPERVDFLEECFINIGRVDIAKKVAAYKMPAATPEQHSSQVQRCRNPCPPPTANSSHSVQQTRQGQPLHTAPENLSVPVSMRQNYQNPVQSYKFNTDPRGVCIIIDCVGNDGDMLEQTFTALHFNVILYKWLSVDDTLSALRGIVRQRENHRGDGFVCCIISRGTAHNLLCTDSYSAGIYLDSIRRLFTADACPMLVGKPKLFFIQRYKTPEFQFHARMHHRDEDLETDGCDGLSRYNCIPTDADVFWSHCWTDEHQLEQGHHRSVYLKSLTDALHKGQRRKTSLLDIHTEVNGVIFEHNKKNPGANYHIDLKHTLRKELCF